MTYEEMELRHQKEFNAFPMKFAFSEEQFKEGMEELGLTEDLTEEVYSAPGGGFYRKTDAGWLCDMLGRFYREKQEAIDGDLTGDGFIYDMFLYELKNHEYGYTEDEEETLDALGYTVDEIKGDQRLMHGFEKAASEILGFPFRGL